MLRLFVLGKYLMRNQALLLLTTCIFSTPVFASSKWADCVNSAQVDVANSRTQAAEQKFKQSLLLVDPTSKLQKQWSHLYLGRLYSTQGKIALAEQEFIACSKISPKNDLGVEADEALAKTHLLKGSKSGAARPLNKSKTPSKEILQYMNVLGAKVKSVWNPRDLRTSASTAVCFSLDDEGLVHDVHLDRSSGVASADQIACATIESMPAFGKLPEPGTEPCVLFTFDYNVHAGPKAGNAPGFVPISTHVESTLALKNLKLAEREMQLRGELAVAESSIGVDSSSSLNKTSKLIECLIEEKKFAEARKVVTKILAVYEKGTREDLLAARFWFQLGEIAIAENKLEEARDCYKHSVAICQQSGSEGSPQEKQSMQAYGKCLYKLGDTEAANALYAKLQAAKTSR